MPSYWRHVKQVLNQADIIIEVLDARMIAGTRNKELEEKIKKYGKKILYVITKSDLVDIKKIDKRTLRPSVFISATKHYGTTILKKKILELSRGERVTVGIVGYPNVGKSSLINALAARKAAKTSSESGYTKGMQKIRVDNKILLLDTPGVFPWKEKDPQKHIKIAAIGYSKVKDPETAALHLITEESKIIKKYYQVEGDTPEKIIANIAIKRKKLQKGGSPNTETTSRMILKDWQTGKIHQ